MIESSLEETFKSSFTIHHLLSMKPQASPLKLTCGFTHLSMVPRKSVSPVYMEAADA
jgi:hypothetical protein